MMAGLPKANDSTRAARGGVEAAIAMSESRQLSVVKRRHMAVAVTTTFLLYSTVSTVVFEVSDPSAPFSKGENVEYVCIWYLEL